MKKVKADYISIDNGSLGCDQNHDAVLDHVGRLSGAWTVILEDDAVPIPRFRSQLGQALISAPTPIVSLYLGRQRPPWAQKPAEKATSLADERNADWIVASHLLHGVGYAIRTHLIPSLMNYWTPLPVDQHITAWAQSQGHLIAYTWPCLVDHADQPTIVDHPDNQPRPPGRVAHRAGPHPSWSTRTVSMPI